MHTFLISISADYVIVYVAIHLTFYFSIHAQHFFLSRALVIDWLTCFYNPKNFHNNLASPFGRLKKSLSIFRSLFHFPLFTIPLARCERLALRHPAPSLTQSLTSPGLKVSISAPILISMLNNNIFQGFMRIFIEKPKL